MMLHGVPWRRGRVRTGRAAQRVPELEVMSPSCWAGLSGVQGARQSGRRAGQRGKRRRHGQIPEHPFKHWNVCLASVLLTSVAVYWGLTKESDDEEAQAIGKSAIICIRTSAELLGILFSFPLRADVEILLKNPGSRQYSRVRFWSVIFFAFRLWWTLQAMLFEFWGGFFFVFLNDSLSELTEWMDNVTIYISSLWSVSVM